MCGSTQRWSSVTVSLRSHLYLSYIFTPANTCPESLRHMKMFHIVKAVAADDTLRSCETVIKPTHTTLPGRRQLEKTTRQ